MNLLDYIPMGRSNAITARELIKRTGHENVRLLQRDIHRLRTQGKIILSATDSPRGYYLPESDREIKMFCRSMRSRVREIEAAIRPALEYLTGDSNRGR